MPLDNTTTKSDRDAKLARIRALMAKTVDNGCTEEEAKSAAAAVDRLLALYEIDLDEVAMKEQPIGPRDTAIGKHAIVSAASRIAAFTDCRVWVNTKTGNLTYFGFQVDTEIADYLTMLFMRAIDREVATFILFNRDYDEHRPDGKREMIRAFGSGMAIRLGERLKELKSKRDFSARAPGNSLVLIKMPMVNEAMREAGIHLSRARQAPAIRDHGSYGAGWKAADNVALNQGISNRAAMGGRIR